MSELLKYNKFTFPVDDIVQEKYEYMYDILLERFDRSSLKSQKSGKCITIKLDNGYTIGCGPNDYTLYGLRISKYSFMKSGIISYNEYERDKLKEIIFLDYMESELGN